MAILRKEQRGQYTVIDQAIFKDKSLSNKALGMLCRMLSLPDGWEFSVEGLAKLSTDGVSAVRSQLNELEEHGYLGRKYVRGSGKISGIEYVVSETRMCDFLKSENLISENLISENRPQSNTKESNTKESNTKESNNISSSLRSEDIYEGMSENLISALKDFEEMRKKIKSPMTERAKVSLVNKLQKLAGDDEELKIAILDEAILNNWKSVYPLKENNNGRTEHDTRRGNKERTGVERTTVGSDYDYGQDAAKLPGMVFGISQEE